MNKDALEKLFQIINKQQKILTKLAQMPAPDGPLTPFRPAQTVYSDPNSDEASDLKESVRALTNESPSMGDIDEPPTSDVPVIRADLINTISFKMRKHFPNMNSHELKLKVLNAIHALGL